MIENQPVTIHTTRGFLTKMMRHVVIGLLLFVVSLGIGMAGYHHFEGMHWVDAYVNAAMILSGMGPVEPLHSVNGKIFAGSYAIFSGVIFLVGMAIIWAPVFHRFFHKIHLEASKEKEQSK